MATRFDLQVDHPHLPLGVVASRTGLRDATYLVRRFKDRYGTTPDRWRRNERT